MTKKLTRILVVDDYKDWRYAVGRIIESSPDCTVISEASDGAEAVQKATNLQPDLITLDIGLPVLNGIEVSRLIRQKCPQTRVVFVTQNSDSEIRQAAIGTGAVGYVLKSNARHELPDVIATALNC